MTCWKNKIFSQKGTLRRQKRIHDKDKQLFTKMKKKENLNEKIEKFNQVNQS